VSCIGKLASNWLDLNLIRFFELLFSDIKCENLLLDSNYTLKLIDFGFARNKMNGTDGKNMVYSKTYCGSYAYASPEILKGTGVFKKCLFFF
jgi:serine/threonine protein kinase